MPLPDDPDFMPELVRAFPTAVRERFLDRIRTHTLRREITATALVNGMVNRAGHDVRVPDRRGDRRATVPTSCARDEAARAIFDQDALWRDIEALDGAIGVDVQTEMYLASRRLVRAGARWLLRNRPAAAAGRGDGRVLRGTGRAPDRDGGGVAARRGATPPSYAAQGVPHDLAQRIAGARQLPARSTSPSWPTRTTWRSRTVAETYDEVGDRLRFEWLGDRIVELPRVDRWDGLARNAMREDAAAQYRRVVDAAMTAGSYEAWAAPRGDRRRPRARVARRDPRPRGVRRRDPVGRDARAAQPHVVAAGPPAGTWYVPGSGDRRVTASRFHALISMMA